MAISINAFFVAQRGFDGLAEADSDIFGCMVAIDVGVSIAMDFKVNQAVPGEKGQHVIQKAQACGNGRLAGAIQIDGEADFCFGSIALNFEGSGHGSPGLRIRVYRLVSSDQSCNLACDWRIPTVQC
jgi:hypothetical protein